MRNLLVALVVVIASGSAWAKPKVAILGLEAAKGDDVVALAKAVTTALRDRVKAGTGSYVLAPNSERELVDTKMLANCETEATACMAKIGADLGVDILVFGHLKKYDKGYDVVVKVLDVAKKKVALTMNDVIVFAEAASDKLPTWVKAFYGRMLP